MLNKASYNVVFVLLIIGFAQTISKDITTHKFNLERGLNLKYSNPDSAVYYLTEAKEYIDANQVDSLRSYITNQVAFATYMQGRSYEAIKLFFDANEIAKEQKQLGEKAYALNGLGLVYWSQSDDSTAIRYFDQSLSIYQNLNDSVRISMVFKNLSKAYNNLNDNEKALQLIKESRDYLKTTPNHFGYAMISNQIGDNLIRMGLYNEAELNFLQTLNENENVTTGEKAFALWGIAQIELERKNFKKAIAYAEESLALSKEVNAFAETSNAAQVMANAYQEIGDLYNAMKYLKVFYAYRDSVSNEKSIRQIDYLQLQYIEAERERLENLAELKTRQASFNQKLIILLFVLFIISVGAVVFFKKSLTEKALLSARLERLNEDLSLQKAKIEDQNTDLQNLIDDKNHIFSIISHDLRGPLGSIQQIVDIFDMGLLSSSEIDEAMQKLSIQIHSTRSMLDQVLLWASTQMKGQSNQKKAFDLSKLVSDVVDHFTQVAKLKGINLAFEHNTNSSKVFADINQIRIVIQNLISNAIKFTSNGDKISLNVEHQQDRVLLSISDTGVGMPEDKLMQFKKENKKLTSTVGTKQEKGTGLGLYLVKDFLNQNEVSFDVKSKVDEGTQFFLYFKNNPEYNT